MAKCKYKNVTTYPSSTNFIILLRQAVKFFRLVLFHFLYSCVPSACHRGREWVLETSNPWDLEPSYDTYLWRDLW